MSTRLMLSLVNDMLDFSSILSRQFKKKLRRFDVRAALVEAGDLLRFMIEEKGLRLNVRTHHIRPQFVYSDRDRLIQVTVNLLGNACKYTMRGQITLTAEIEQEDEMQVLRVSVEDTGIGIKEEDLRNLFKMFYRIKEGTQLDRNGIGLGLNICKSIVGEFGGDVTVCSEFGKGSIFSFYFELSDHEEEERKEEAETRAPSRELQWSEESRLNITEGSKIEGLPFLANEG